MLLPFESVLPAFQESSLFATMQFESLSCWIFPSLASPCVCWCLYVTVMNASMFTFSSLHLKEGILNTFQTLTLDQAGFAPWSHWGDAKGRMLASPRVVPVPIDFTWKDAQHHSLLEKCKSKWQRGIPSHWSEWPPSKSLQIINAGEGVERKGTILHCW